jgi:hypothetical protein
LHQDKKEQKEGLKEQMPVHVSKLVLEGVIN